MDRGQSLIIPHLFDDINYAYWKVRMRAFLQSLDEKVWQAVEIGWTKPKEAQQAEFEISMIGELTHFLGLQICQQDSGIFLSQFKYAKNLVKKFGLESASFVRTLMSLNVKLTVDLLGKSVDHSLYRSMISSILYLIASRPDISYSVGVCARYQANPKESHMTALKRIIKYVKTTVEFGVWYSKDTSDVLAEYSDVDWVGNANDRKSTSRGCFYVGNNLVSWISKKQNSIFYLLLKLSTLLPVAVTPNSYGCKNSSMIMVFVKSILQSIVTILVPLISLRIRFNILEPNT